MKKNFKLLLISLLVSNLYGCAVTQTKPIEKEKINENIINAVTVEKIKTPEIKEELKKEVLAKKFDLNVYDVPIKTVLDNLFSKSNFNIIYENEANYKNITLDLKQTTLFNLLETLKKVYSYDYEVIDNNVYFYSDNYRMKVYNINHLIGTRVGKTELKINSGSISSTVGSTSNNSSTSNSTNSNTSSNSDNESSRVTTSVNNDFWKELLNNVTTLVSRDPDAKVALSQETNSLTVKAKAKDLVNIENYLKSIQKTIDKQVIIEAKIIEVELKNSSQKGINWAAFGNGFSAGFTTNGSTLGTSGNLGTTVGNAVSMAVGSSITNTAVASGNSLFTVGIQSQNFASILNFLETQGNLQVLSSPRIATMNNQKALLKVGTDEFFITNITTTTTTSGTGSTVTPSVTTQPFFSGIALDITPQIDQNESVTMHVKPAVSQVSTVTKNINLGTLGNLVLPLASSSVSETDSVVKVGNNKIVAIGGLMKQYNKKNKSNVPGLSDVSLIGEAFKNSDSESVKYELVILLKPQIINGLSDWDSQLNDVKERLKEFNTEKNTFNVIEDIKVKELKFESNMKVIND